MISLDIIRKQERTSPFEKGIAMLGLVVLCIAINITGAWIANNLGLPMYLDLIGTVLASMLGGFIPGILVGLLGSLFTTITSDPMAISYSVLAVAIAVVSALFYENDWLKKPLGIIGLILIDAVIGGVFGGIITWYLYGFGGEDASSSLVRAIYNLGVASAFGAELIAGFLVDVLDKIISVGSALLIVKLLPDSINSKREHKSRR